MHLSAQLQKMVASVPLFAASYFAKKDERMRKALVCHKIGLKHFWKLARYLNLVLMPLIMDVYNVVSFEMRSQLRKKFFKRLFKAVNFLTDLVNALV